MTNLSFSFPAFITYKNMHLYAHLQNQLMPHVTELAPQAAHEFLLTLPEVEDDSWLSNVISLASKLPQLDLNRLQHLHLPGIESVLEMYNILAKGMHFDAMQAYEQRICDAAQQGLLGKQELATMQVRRLLIERGILEKAQLSYVQRLFSEDQRESLPEGSGVWLGCDASVFGLKFALESILSRSQSALDRIGLILLSPSGLAAPGMVEVAKKFKNAVLIKYDNEAHLIERLRELRMRVFIELHGLQNPVTFIESLKTGVANTQLTWAGLPESCPLPFIDGQLLDPVLAQSSDASCRPLPLHCWLPPPTSYLKMKRGDSLGIWSVSRKISRNFLYFSADLASRLGCKLQLWTITQDTQLGALPSNVEVVSRFENFCPSVLLDASPISGGLPCLFALQNGIPVVTMPGFNISSRLGASILLHYAFPEGVVASFDEYAERVTEFYKLRKMPRIPHQIEWEFIGTVDRFFPA
nr:hypothetical protein [uncultured Undibacterium sp.]